ncbi:hypothetical protein VPHG_00118 [Vibrio phage 11895-B1]|uniref:hypothetical protein n=1 Tax=Vibrio phage 11895-B1 TaxID=754075 RepID=UPI0002C1592E|nr:hypothetical protein VPHG_00118 [Vibrio phage 11895-B1]AGH32185.1 hypothetical protein VPHG_00118 [Vibrio phage 11895-B1]
MIELKNLSQEERTLITIGCEPFYISYKMDNQLKPIHDHLMQYFPSNHKKEVWVFICASVNPIKYNLQGSLFSLRKENYTTANKKNNTSISYVKCKRVVETLDQLGYITLYKGFYDHYKDLSLKSCFIIQHKLVNLFDSVNISRIGRPRPVETFIELRDSSSDELITELSKLRGIKGKRDLVKRFNELLLKFDIRCKLHPVCAVYKRVYTDDLLSHGRWYSQSSLQTTESSFRKYLTINGYKTTEVDFRQQHPRILLDLDCISKPMSWEPYVDIKDLTEEGDETNQSRSLSKMAMMCLLNADTLRSAKSALWKHYDKFKQTHYNNVSIKEGIINKIFDRLVEKNKDIAHWFGKEGLWKILQHYDSEIAAFIIEKFISMGKCILPWHDSFVVVRQDRDLLIDTMREAWKHVLGSNKNCFYDIEF